MDELEEETVKEPIYCRNCRKHMKMGEVAYGGVNYPGHRRNPNKKQLCEKCYQQYVKLNAEEPAMNNAEIQAINELRLQEAKDLMNRIVKPIPKDERCCNNCRNYGASHLYSGEGHCYKKKNVRVETRPWEVCDDFEEGPSDIVSGNAPSGTLAIKIYGGWGCGKSFLLGLFARRLREMKDIQMVSVDHDEHIMIIQAVNWEKKMCEERGEDYGEYKKRCEEENKECGYPSKEPDFPEDIKAVIKKISIQFNSK